MKVECIIEYAPRAQFLPLHQTDRRFSVILAHRRSGKTVAGLAKALQRLFEVTRASPPPRVGVLFPYLKQAKTNAWNYLKQMTRHLPERAVNESELKITFFGQREIRLYGADNPNGIRGGYFDHVFLDEWAFADPSVWPMIIRPMLADRGGTADVASTPNGKNHFFDLWTHAQKASDHHTLALRADESGLISADELESIRNDPQMTPEKYAQEFLCSFEAATEGSYYSAEMNRAHEEGRITKLDIDAAKPVVTAWDFGNSDETVIWFIQWQPGQLRFIDYYSATRQTIEHYCGVVKSKPYRYVAHYAPHDLEQFHFGMLNSRENQFKQHGLSLVRLPRIKSEMEGINALRSILPICHFDADRCAYGIEALRHYRAEYDDDRKVYRETPHRDWAKHSADAAAQAALAYKSIFRNLAPERANSAGMPVFGLPTFNDFLGTEKNP